MPNSKVGRDCFHKLVAVKNACGIVIGKNHNGVKEFFKFRVRAIDKPDFACVLSGFGGEFQIVVGNGNGVDGGEVDCAMLAGDEFHNVHILGLHYNICENRAKHAKLKGVDKKNLGPR